MTDKPRITEDEWLNELLAAQRPNDPGMTMRELAKFWNCSPAVANKRLHILNDAGCVRPGRRSTTRVDGVPTTVSTYQFVRPKKGEKK